MTEISRGRAAYEAYAAGLPHLNFEPWDDISDDLKSVMEAVGAAANKVHPADLTDLADWVALMRERDELRALIVEILGTFHAGSDGHRARVGRVQIARWHERAGIEPTP